MNDNSSPHSHGPQPFNIDILFADTWLAVCQLRNGAKISNGKTLYRQACHQIDSAREALESFDAPAQSIEHILYALCALWDESVMNRHELDEGYHEWLKSPLQAKYFNTLEAGERLWDRIRGVMAQPSADIAVLTCFHRVLLLGFSGRYREQDDPRGENIREALSKRVAPFTVSQDLPIMASQGRRLAHKKSIWMWLPLTAFALVALWWQVDSLLQQYISQMLP